MNFRALQNVAGRRPVLNLVFRWVVWERRPPNKNGSLGDGIPKQWGHSPVEIYTYTTTLRVTGRLG